MSNESDRTLANCCCRCISRVSAKGFVPGGKGSIKSWAQGEGQRCTLGNSLSVTYLPAAIADKINHVHSDVDYRIGAQNQDGAQGHPACPVFWDAFHSVRPENVDRIRRGVRPPTSALDPCPSCLIKAAQEELVDWLSFIGNASLIEERVPNISKEMATSKDTI